MTDGRTIERQILIDADLDRVWTALTDPGDLGHWLCERAFFRPEAGAPYRWEWGGGLHADGQILELDASRAVRLSYRVPAFTVSLQAPTELLLAIEPGGSAAADTRETRIRVSHMGFGRGAEWDAFFRGHEESWDIDLAELRELCEGRSLEEVRRLEVPAEVGMHRKILEQIVGVESGGGTGPGAADGAEAGAVVERSGATLRSDHSTVHAFTTPTSVVVTIAVPDEATMDSRADQIEAVLKAHGSGDVRIGSPYG